MHLIRSLLDIYILILIADVVLSYLPQFRSHDIAKLINKAANYSLDPIRKVLPEDLPFDLSPIVAILLINLLQALW